MTRRSEQRVAREDEVVVSEGRDMIRDALHQPSLGMRSTADPRFCC